ncbi:FabD lysophospholipase-like protein [Coniophora puteana RWD-64-598 SS2]|uniref:FabD lysophospholipase-like protein n=1 Tax=Coniophora puteana (strain RWD-64-598) TaxID=741705 RepID=A0A5M3MDX8_CONPW|nr:FabD lysophospholipase-like protein [Coniophora puteana RWD-64-598 SS2]EIW77247.1 FabD lysophospholipase-like protein [Coniophora puteana RWD-64-598 SS2]
MAEKETKSLRLLSIDGGGICGMSALLIIRKMMRRIEAEERLSSTPAPHAYFDMIGGTGTGGIIALMLGRLRMSVDDAIKEYDGFIKAVYVDGRKRRGEEMFKAEALKEKMRGVVGAYCDGNKDARMVEDAECKAARATTAHPGHYKPITISDGVVNHEYVDAGMGSNNPCRVLLDEAASVYPTRSLGAVVSIGTGRAQTIGVPVDGVRGRKFLPSDLLDVLRDVAADCERVSEEMEKHFLHYPELYFRFNVMHGMQSISWDAWDRQSAVAAHTAQYMQIGDVDSRVDWCWANSDVLGGSYACPAKECWHDQGYPSSFSQFHWQE